MRMRSISLALALVAGALAASPSPARSAVLDDDLFGPGVSPRAIVVFDHDVDARTLRRLAGAGVTGAVVLDSIDAVIAVGDAKAYRTIATWRDVRAVDADSPIRLDNSGAKKDTKVAAARTGARPLRRGYTGKGVTIGVMDSGIDSAHPGLTDRVVKHVNFEFTWFVDAVQDGEYTDRFAEATGNPIDSIGHGTHVAGIVAGTGAGAEGADLSGVAPEASLVNLKIVDAHHGVVYDFGFEANALIAYEWLIRNRKDPAFPGGLRAVNNSWSVVEADDEIEPIVLMVKAAHARGIASIFSAGNAGPDEDTQGHGPNRSREAIVVAAACKTAEYRQISDCAAGSIAGFSSRGRTVDVTAPGVDIWSAAARHSVLAPLGSGAAPPGASDPAASARNAVWYISLSGTSMSAPHVAGIVALLLQANPKLTPSQVESLLVTTARDRGRRGHDTAWGHGFVDAHAALAKAVAPARKPAPKRR